MGTIRSVVTDFPSSSPLITPGSIGAEAEGVAAELLALHNTAGGQHSDQFSGKANRSVMTTIVINPETWKGDAAPYTLSLGIAAVTATSIVEIAPKKQVSLEELTALQEANIVDGGQKARQITLWAYGKKPEIPVTLRIIVRGDL